ncbi:glycosyltransferase [Pseudomonas sp. P105]|uniref:glycosyltransferase family 2 protein n=1 Tax=Pseudomonas sp. P105 TaxID=3049542 RepID=UPI0029351629|nr:glycosyltransferase [Pseudomonas sp. P105]WNZ80059.1 glycosyltransferase [Pseudomonas sp. P105]
MLKKICIVPVCYNAHEDAVRFLDSVDLAFRACPDFALEVVLADNSTIAPSMNIASRQYAYSFTYMKNDNVGYFPAFNKAFANQARRAEDYDFVIVCNVDLVVAEDFFSVLLTQSVGSETGLVAAGIFSDRDGRDLNPKIARRPTARKINFMRIVCSSVVLFRGYMKLARMRERARSRTQQRDRRIAGTTKVVVPTRSPMYGAHGSFMVFTRRYFTKGADVAYPRFLFGEEVFVAEQLLRHNLSIQHVPGLRVFDKEHASTSKVNFDFICGEHKKSYDYLYTHFYKGRV